MKNKIIHNSIPNKNSVHKKNMNIISNKQDNTLRKNKKKSYSLPKNTIINILSIFCKYKNKKCIYAQHLLKKKKIKKNVKKIFNTKKINQYKKK